MELKIDDFQMTLHLNLKSSGVCHYSGVINAPDHKLHGSKIYKTVRTPKSLHTGWGVGKVTFQLENDDKEFKDFDKLIEYYKLPPLKKEKS